MLAKYQKPFAKKLKIARVELELTQSKAAELLGVSIVTYSRWESGKHEPMNVYKKIIAEKMNVEY